MNKPKLGATGEYPRGKLNPDDEGALMLGVGPDGQGNVRVEFGKPVAWLALPRAEAIAFASLILKHARALPRVQ